MEKKKISKKTLFIILGVLFLGVLTVIGTYAYFAWSSTSEDKDATVSVTSVSDLGRCNKVTDNRKLLWPVSSRDNGRIVNVNAKQTLSEYAYITWTLTIDSINTPETETDGLKHRSFKYELVNTTTGISYGSGNFEGKNVGDTITFSNNTENLAYDTTYTFTLYLWIDGTIGRNPMDMTDQTYQFSLVCEITGEPTNKVHNQIVPPIIEPTDASFFQYMITGDVTYTVSDQSACESYFTNVGFPSADATTLCTGGKYSGYTLGDYIAQGQIPSSAYENLGISNVVRENGEVTIAGYKESAATYTVTDQSACESYFVNMGLPSADATSLCTGGKYSGYTLGDLIDQGEIPSSDYSAAGLNVVTVPAPTDVVIPSEIEGYPVTKIYASAFESKGLTSVVIPNSVTSIGRDAFRGNDLTLVEIPGSITSLGSAAFYGNKLTSVVIQNGVTSIGREAFRNNKLTSVVIPNSVTTIEPDAFYNNSLTSVEISNGVTSIGIMAFYHNQLTSVVIPGSVTSIGDNAFEENSLTSVVISNGVTSIGKGAFRNNSLTSVEIPNSVSLIDQYAFYNNLFTSITIGNQNATIRNCAFGENPPLGEPFISSYKCENTGGQV